MLDVDIDIGVIAPYTLTTIAPWTIQPPAINFNLHSETNPLLTQTYSKFNSMRCWKYTLTTLAYTQMAQTMKIGAGICSSHWADSKAMSPPWLCLCFHGWITSYPSCSWFYWDFSRHEIRDFLWLTVFTTSNPQHQTWCANDPWHSRKMSSPTHCPTRPLHSAGSQVMWVLEETERADSCSRNSSESARVQISKCLTLTSDRKSMITSSLNGRIDGIL